MGSAIKADLKINISHEIGVRVDDILEGARKELQRAVGAHVALTEVAKLVQALHSIADKEIEEEKLDLVAGKHVKHYITRAVTAIESMAQKSANAQSTISGRIQGLEVAVGSIKKFHDSAITEKQLIEATPGPVENAPMETNADTPRPGLSVKQRRLAEEALLNIPTENPIKKIRKPRAKRKI